jgi:enamine deaminase RidA (YjgF/YER057c/UK114 family)
MARSISGRIAELGLELPEPSKPGANYATTIWDGDRIWISGQLAQWNGERRFVGKLGREYSLAQGQAAAQMAALNCIAHLRSAVADELERVRQCLRVGVYVNSAKGFTGQSQVANGASDLLVQLLGDSGRHTRLAIGVAALPYDVAVEVEMVFRVAGLQNG